ncbi:MAG TPA: hypothetical protein VJJ80_03505 [Patescibacteria group bacterium]|nr:hypothetical protein [Patescibacteria group bacterium]
MKKKQIAGVLVVLSGLAIILAFIGSLNYDLWLASTQWLLIGIALAAYGIYAKL